VETDERRGKGVHERIQGKMEELKKAGIFFSLSLTVTRTNYETRARLPAVFIAVPWDEEEQGGCLASGRGFVHISASGDLEPCPFAPYSDANLLNMPLKDALRSRFLGLMRENHDMFAETAGGCALWKNKEAVESLLRRKIG
jgi:MoaA/NifB/PqqE/SkfB family radical SAM enzyme